MSFTVACVLRSGGVYTAQWMDRLAVATITHLQPAAVVCLTDTEGWSGPYEFVPLRHNWPGWYSKIELFRPGLFSGRVLYFDLDSVLVKPFPVDALFEQLLWSGHSIALLDDFYTPAKPASGVIAWAPCAETEKIYHDFAKAPQFSARWDRGDGYHIGRHPHVRLQQLLPGVFGSLKKDRLDKGPLGFAHVSCHGRPKMSDLPVSHWMRQIWEGKPNTKISGA